MSSRPLVSIVTPSYNQEEFLEDNLRSVLNQDYPRVQHIVLDGESDDETVKLLEEYEDKYNLEWVSEPDDGQSDAVNKGFEQADGEIVGWLNADDVYFSERAISAVVAAFEDAPDADVVYGDDVFLDRTGRITRARRLYNWDYDRMLRWGWWGWTPASEAMFYRHHVVDAERLNERLDYVLDFEYFLRLGRKYDFSHLNEVIAGKRQHEETKSSHRDLVTEEAGDVLSDYEFELTARNQAKLLATLVRIQIQWIVGLPLVLRARNEDFAFDGRRESPLRTIISQLPKPPL